MMGVICVLTDKDRRKRGVLRNSSKKDFSMNFLANGVRWWLANAGDHKQIVGLSVCRVTYIHLSAAASQ